MNFDWQDLLGDAAPVIGGILGGPAGAAVGGLIANALGVGDSEADLADALKKNPQLAAKVKALEISQGTQLAQLQAQLSGKRLDIIKTYAASPSVFKSGGRPFLLWTCGAAFAWQYVIGPMASWLASLAGHPLAIPTLDMSVMMPVLIGLLGLGGMQSFDRLKGTSAEHKAPRAPAK